MAKKDNWKWTAQRRGIYDDVSRRFQISEQEFKEYYSMVEQANKKARDLKYRAEKMGRAALYIPRYTHSMKMIDTRERFEEYRASVADVLTKDWRLRQNERMQEQFAKNLQEAFGAEAAEPVIEKMRLMRDDDLQKALKESKYIESIFYDSKTAGLGGFAASIRSEMYKIFGVTNEDVARIKEQFH